MNDYEDGYNGRKFAGSATVTHDAGSMNQRHAKFQEGQNDRMLADWRAAQSRGFSGDLLAWFRAGKPVK